MVWYGMVWYGMVDVYGGALACGDDTHPWADRVAWVVCLGACSGAMLHLWKHSVVRAAALEDASLHLLPEEALADQLVHAPAGMECKSAHSRSTASASTSASPATDSYDKLAKLKTSNCSGQRSLSAPLSVRRTAARIRGVGAAVTIGACLCFGTFSDNSLRRVLYTLNSTRDHYTSGSIIIW